MIATPTTIALCPGPSLKTLHSPRPKLISLQENWFTLTTLLQASTSYGPRKALLELVRDIRIPGTFEIAWVGVISSPLAEINDFLKSSREILELEQDWDGEGASQIAESTWHRAAEFLRQTASTFWTKYHLPLERPSVAPVADGSIDLHWKLSSRELLVNISPSDEKWARYYGDNKLGWNVVEGKLDIRAPNQWLFVWLTE